MSEAVYIFAGSAALVGLFTYVAFLEKVAVVRHHYAHFVLSRTFYMLLLAIIMILIWDPKVLSSRVMLESLRDPIVLGVGAMTTIGVFLYYWLLTKGDLYLVSMAWPIVMIFTVIVAALAFKEKINALQWLGVLIAFIGLTMIAICKK